MFDRRYSRFTVQIINGQAGEVLPENLPNGNRPIGSFYGRTIWKARMRSRMLICINGACELARVWIDVVMPLCRARNAVRPMQPGVKPLRRIGRTNLPREHRRHLVVIDSRIFV